MKQSRQRGQSVVEFGIVAIVFTLIMFAIADFGLLLNDWLSVSDAVRTLGRDASVGNFSCTPSQCPAQADLWNQAAALKIPGVTADPHFANKYCCAPGNALVLSVTYYDECTPNAGSAPCNPVNPGQLDNRYSSGGVQGGCPPPSCPHPSPPAQTNPASGLPNCDTGPTKPCPGDSVVVTLTAAGAQVITPLVRPFFTKPNECPSVDSPPNSLPSRCFISLSSTITMRFEGEIL